MRIASILLLGLIAAPAAASPSAPAAPAPAAPAAVPSPAPTRPTYARANRLAINLGFGFGSGSLGQLSDDMTASVQRTNPGLQVSAPHSSIQINAEIAFRYYAPFYILGQVGADCVYNKASSSLPAGYVGSLANDNLVIEVPILLGGYYPFFGRLYVFGAVGPAILVYPRAFWDPGMDFKADVGVGAHVLVGVDFMLSDHVSIGLELRYRYAKSGELKEKNTDTLIRRGDLLGDGSTATYNLDLSGISLGINLRFYAL